MNSKMQKLKEKLSFRLWKQKIVILMLFLPAGVIDVNDSFLNGCARPPNTVRITETAFVVCPVRPVSLDCEAWDELDGSSTFRDLLLAYNRNKVKYESCQKTVELWKTEHQRCSDAYMKTQ